MALTCILEYFTLLHVYLHHRTPSISYVASSAAGRLLAITIRSDLDIDSGASAENRFGRGLKMCRKSEKAYLCKIDVYIIFKILSKYLVTGL